MRFTGSYASYSTVYLCNISLKRFSFFPFDFQAVVKHSVNRIFLGCLASLLAAARLCHFTLVFVVAVLLFVAAVSIVTLSVDIILRMLLTLLEA